MRTVEIDVLLQDGETGQVVCAELARRFGVQAEVAAQQYNSATTLTVTGTPDQLRRVNHWHNAPRTPRPDLRGKAPVAKGKKRT